MQRALNLLHVPRLGGLDSNGTVPINGTMTTTPAAAARAIPLPHMGLLKFSGPDAASFLQGQVSNDTAALTRGSPLLAAYSTPQGRVVALLHLLPHSTGILALLPHEIVLPTLERLRKFVMRAKVTIEDVGDRFAVWGQEGGDALAGCGLAVPEPTLGYAEQHAIGVSRVGPANDRFWIVGATTDLRQRGFDAPDALDSRVAPSAAGAPSAAHENAWRLANIRAGVPQIYAATREMFVAQMLNMDLIGGISFTKGCYTGQEIIARTQHLGRIKRRLFRLRLPHATWAVGQAIHMTDGRSGRLTELAQANEGFEALAVLTIEAGEPAEPAGARTTSMLNDATQLPLPYEVMAP